MQEESTIDVTQGQSDPGANLAGESSTPQDTGTPSSQDVNTGLADQQAAPTPDTATDPLAGIPSTEELQAMRDRGVDLAAGLLNVRTAYDTLKPQFDDVSGKYKIFEPFADRFSTPEDVQKIVQMQESLYGWAPDPVSGELVPTTDKFVEQLPPETASFLTADLLHGELTLPDGRRVQRLEVVLDSLGKERVLKHFGVDATQSVAPSWAPSAEELEKVKPEYHELYKKLPFETREELKLNSPEFINDALRKERIIQDTETDRTERKQREEAHQKEQQQLVEREAVQAGDGFIDQEIRTGFQGFYQSICERWQPTDDPQTNKVAGALVASLVVNLAHNETRSVTEAALKEIGLLDDKSIQSFDRARNDFAQNAYNYGYLSKKQGPNGQSGLGMIKSQSSRGLQGLIAQGNNLATQIIGRIDKLFLAKANAHNHVLDQAVNARPPINGNPVNPATSPGMPAIAGPEPFSDASVTRFIRS